MSKGDIAGKVRAITNRQVPGERARDVRLLRSLVERSERIIRSKYRSLSGEARTVAYRIATVSSDLHRDDLTANTESAERGYKTYTIKTKRLVSKLRRDFLEDLQQAIHEGAEIVCFNELSFPCGMEARSSVERRRFERHIRQLVDAHGILLIAGSFHDPETDHNLCPIFAPKKSEMHAKLTSAERLGEEVRTPPGRTMRHYRTKFGRASVLVCLDVFEPTLFLRLLRESNSFSAGNIELVFVPSFSPQNTQLLCDACEDLSYVTGAVVVFVNCADPRHALFVHGRVMPNESTQPDGYQRRVVSQRIVLHTVRVDTQRTRRNLLRDSYSPILRFMMGDEAPIFVEVPLE